MTPITSLTMLLPLQNRLPDDLYHHGVQKDRMNSFLEGLKARCTVYELNGGRDWRLGRDEEVDQETGEKALARSPKKRTWFGWGQEEKHAFEQDVKAVVQDRQGEIPIILQTK